MDQNKLEKDICICENSGCENIELKHFEKCPKCGSEAYHKTIHAYEEVKGGEEECL